MSVGTRELEKKIVAVDDLADQMTWRYGWEIRRHRGCRDSQALYTQMKTHAGFTDRLKKAYEGTCPTSFRNAANNVRSSVTSLEVLSRRAHVSSSVLALIEQSCPLSTYIQGNIGLFRPAIPQPTYDPVYFELGRNIDDIDRISISMVNTYYNEVGSKCQCASTRAMLESMRDYTRLTGDLVKAYRGTCPKTFKKAACAVRDSLTNIERLSNRVSVSYRVDSLMEQACPKTTFVHKNSSRFQPYAATNYRNSSGSYGHGHINAAYGR